MKIRYALLICAALLALTNHLRAEVLVAEDFLYSQPTKALSFSCSPAAALFIT